jgi:hypothetical protein
VNLDGKVTGTDTRAIYGSGAFNDGLTTHDWSVGDMNYDGRVNGVDTRLIFGSGNFNNLGQTFTAKTLTASPAVDPTLNPISLGQSGDGKPDVIYDPSTGDLTYVSDGYTETVFEVLLHSEGNKFNVANFSKPQGSSFSSNTLDIQNPSGYTTFDFGDVLPTGLTGAQLLSDMATYTGNNDTYGLGAPGLYLVGGSGAEHFYDVSVPEPTGLALAGVAAVGLLGRKRRKAK